MQSLIIVRVIGTKFPNSPPAFSNVHAYERTLKIESAVTIDPTTLFVKIDVFITSNVQRSRRRSRERSLNPRVPSFQLLRFSVSKLAVRKRTAALVRNLNTAAKRKSVRPAQTAVPSPFQTASPTRLSPRSRRFPTRRRSVLFQQQTKTLNVKRLPIDR